MSADEEQRDKGGVQYTPRQNPRCAGSDDKAAMLIAACAETLHLHGEKVQANAFLIAVREHFPRHRAFQSELNGAVRLMQ